MQQDNLLTHKDLAKYLSVSETTIKSYRKKFPNCIPIANTGKPIRFKPEAIKVALRIKELFETGMAVKEVRKKLSEEFSWIKLEENSQTKTKKSDNNITEQTMSKVLQGVISVSQQQKMLMQRMHGIENFLQTIGYNSDQDQTEYIAKKTNNKINPELEKKVENLDDTTKKLSMDISNLTDQIYKFFSEYPKNRNSNENLESNNKHIDFSSYRKDKEIKDIQAPKTFNQKSFEPERIFFTLPLLTYTADNQFISAGGKNRGRFCLNDLKAMLVYGVMPPNQYVLQWEPTKNGWWLYLIQPEKENGNSISLFIEEHQSNTKEAFLLITQVFKNGENLPPVSVCKIIDTLHE